jgi:hypothetical protein
VSGQLQARIALTPGKRAPGTHWIEAPAPVWTTWRSEILTSTGTWNSDPSVVQSVASRYTDCAIPAPTVMIWIIFILILSTQHYSDSYNRVQQNMSLMWVMYTPLAVNYYVILSEIFTYGSFRDIAGNSGYTEPYRWMIRQ